MLEAPKTAKVRATRERIPAAAAELVRERGVVDTTLEDALERAQASKSRLYHYFGDRSALLRAAIAHTADTALAGQ